ncbi:MAG: FAD-dependent oxidoreductase [Pseudomonadota bacterium]
MTETLIDRRRLLAGAGAAALAGCGEGERVRTGSASRQGLKPIDLSLDSLMRITVCVRPFRPVGPRLDVEALGAKTLVHSYGHGGSGWSLAWGSAEAAAALVLETSPASVAVVGAGAIGLTLATLIQRTGVPTTIYANEFPAETRSARATGVWSPDSRIALAPRAAPGFPERWEALARRSYARHLQYVGLAGAPVEFTPQFYVPAEEGWSRPEPEREDDFLHMRRRLAGLAPPWSDIAPEDHPFTTTETPRGGLGMVFNVAEYAHRLMTDFLLMGGAMVRRSFQEPADLAALAQPVVANCTGYGARLLFGDESLVPVRGQIGWLAPQTDRLYGVFHKQTSILSRRDGVVVQYVGPNDYFGYGIEDETPDREETVRAIKRVAPLFAPAA